jgi:hypothetical protein
MVWKCFRKIVWSVENEDDVDRADLAENVGIFTALHCL